MARAEDPFHACKAGRTTHEDLAAHPRSDAVTYSLRATVEFLACPLTRAGLDRRGQLPAALGQ